jgi:hypothetical protein
MTKSSRPRKPGAGSFTPRGAQEVRIRDIRIADAHARDPSLAPLGSALM